MLEIVNKTVIDFIRDNDQIMLFCDLSDFQHDFTRSDCACGVGWITDKNNLGARRNGLANIIGVNSEIIFKTRGNFNRHTASQDRRAPAELCAREGRAQARQAATDDHHVAPIAHRLLFPVYGSRFPTAILIPVAPRCARPIINRFTPNRGNSRDTLME